MGKLLSDFDDILFSPDLTSCGILFIVEVPFDKTRGSFDNFKSDGCEVPICVVLTVLELGIDEGFMLLLEHFTFVGLIDESFV